MAAKRKRNTGPSVMLKMARSAAKRILSRRVDPFFAAPIPGVKRIRRKATVGRASQAVANTRKSVRPGVIKLRLAPGSGARLSERGADTL